MSDLQGGVTGNLSGRRLSLFQLGRFYGFFFWSVVSTVLFLGAWNLPPQLIAFLREQDAQKAIAFFELIWLLGKSVFLMLLLVWLARVNPKSRVDQVTDFSWKVLSPFSLISLVGASLWAGWKTIL